MRILIHTSAHRLNLSLPMALALNPATAAIIARFLREKANLPLTAEQVQSLFAVIRAEKAHRPDWVPLDIQSGDIRITVRA